MPTYTLLFTHNGHDEAQKLECVAPNPWLALEKVRPTIGRRTVELLEGSHSFGRFRHGFPSGTGVWEISPRS
jgi:hypothetical protein